MSFPKYSNYREIGIEWIRSVPDHWDIVPMKRLLSFENGTDHKNVQSAEGVPVYGSGGIFAYANAYLYDGESILFGRKGTIDKPLHVKGKFWTVDTMYYTKLREGIDGRFGYFMALCFPFGYYSTNTALPSLTKSDLESHKVAIPPLDEQHRLAKFLDRETAKIDALVAEQERLIELLEEKRKAVISQAVTKGLDPTVPMQDSGVSWLGSVPAHWSLRKLKYCARFSGGGTPSRNEPAYWHGHIPWISPKDMKSEIIDVAEENISSAGLENSSSSLIDANHVLLVVRSGILKHTIPVAINSVPVALNQDMKALSFIDGICTPKFFMRWVQGLNETLLLAWAKQGATVESIEQSYLGDTMIPMPPLNEQLAICAYVDSETAKIDALVEEHKHLIDLLEERRSALISAAVTGQIDVRQLEAT